MDRGTSKVGLRQRVATALAVTIFVALAACSSEDSPTVEQSTERTSADTTASRGEAQKTDIDQVFWYAGFEVTLGEATLTPSASSNDLVIEAGFVNQGDEAASFSGVAVSLSSAGESYQPGFESDIPNVPGDASSRGTFVFTVEPSFSFDDAVMTIGNPDNNQAVVPFGDEGELVTNEPVPIESTATGTAGQFTLQLTGGEIRFDDPETHRQMEQDHTLLVLEFDLTRTGGQNANNFIGTENLALRLPEGSTVAVRSDGLSNPNELVQPDSTVKDLFARFEGDIPYAGDYVLILKYEDVNGMSEAEIHFTVAELSAGGGGTGTTAVTRTTN